MTERFLGAVGMPSVITPEFSLKAFTCPHCGYNCQFIDQLIPQTYKGSKTLRVHMGLGDEFYDADPSDFFDFFDPSKYLVKICSHCGKVTLWENSKMVYPYGTSIQPSEYMPKTIVPIFQEAQSITNLSPRAACALLRACLEKLVIKAGGTGDKLFHKIESLKLSSRMKKLADACRLTGNEAVHGTYYDLDVSKDEAIADAWALSRFINRLSEEFFGLDADASEMIERMNEAKKLTHS